MDTHLAALRALENLIYRRIARRPEPKWTLRAVELSAAETLRRNQ